MPDLPVSGPMNPGLFAALQHRFGQVRISNAGVKTCTSQDHDAVTGKLVFRDVIRGEHYRVCCPYCGDGRFRLYVSYLWNLETPSGNNRYRVYCQNENCDMHFFYEELLTKPPEGIGREGVASDYRKLEPMLLPGCCVSLRDLPAGHQALEYIKKRNYDPVELADQWGVCYCVTAAEDQQGRIPGTAAYAGYVRDRLIIPVYWEGKLVGWQARSLQDKTAVRYYTSPGFNKSMVLVNADRARKTSFVVLVEGFFDAFRVGPAHAVPLLGKTISELQRNHLYSLWGRGGGCLILDNKGPGDAQDHDPKYPGRPSPVERVMSSLNLHAFKDGFFNLPPPFGEDPGSMDQFTLWKLISDYARNRGIQLTV